MTIYFNPFEESSVFINGLELGLGKACLGPEGFLRDLELRSGMTRVEDCAMKRIIQYRNALREACKSHPDIFCKDSFDKDDLGTAGVLLRWRDALVRAGWEKGSGEGRKLEGLSIVEDYFDSPGIEDRWRRMLEILKTRRILSEEDSIIVRTSRDDTDPFFVKVLDAIETKGATVSYTEYKKLSHCPTIYSFEDDVEAHKWLSSRNFSEEDVIAGADKPLLNDMLYAGAKPTVGSYGEEIGSIMSLFSLGLSLFNSTIEADNLLAYLQVPIHPLNKAYLEISSGEKTYRVSLRYELEKHLLSSNGTGDKWNEIISSANLSFEGKRLGEDILKETRLFVNMWEKARNGKVHKGDVLEFTDALKQWASAHCSSNVNSDYKAQFLALVDCCDVLALLLETENDHIDVNKLSLWIGRIVSPVETDGDTALKGSVNLVPSPAGVISAPRNLYWNHSVKRSESAVPYEYQFLSATERQSVKGADFPPPDLRSRAERNMTLDALASAKEKVFIVFGRKVAGEMTVQDLVLMEIMQKFNLKKEEIEHKENEEGDKEEPVLKEPFGKALTHTIDKDKVKNFKPKNWSYSSVDELIQHPFDFYVNSILGLEGYGCAGLRNIYQVKGNIAHKYFEHLAEVCGYNIGKMIQEHNLAFDTTIGKIVEAGGIMLLQEEYAIEYRSFRAVLRKSIKSLLSLFQSLDLYIIGVEKEFKDFTLEPFGQFVADIDCLLQDRNGKYVIFDFKWNESEKYKNLLENGDDLQLAFYRKIVEQELGEVAYCGYYVFPAYTFFTNGPLSADGVATITGNISAADLFDQACKAFKFRFKQLEDGIAEEASGMEMDDLDYVKGGYRPALENYNGIKNGGWNGSKALQGGLI